MKEIRWVLYGIIICILSLTPSATSCPPDRDMILPITTFYIQQEEYNETDPIVVRFLSPQEGDTVLYGTVDICFDIKSEHGISSLNLLVGNEELKIGNYEIPYKWKPRRDGAFILTLECSDYLSNSISESVHIRVVMRQVPISTIVVGVLVGFIALGAIVYRHKFERSPALTRYYDHPDTLVVPLHYLIRSRLRQRGRHES
ncbi:MAG: hypothetical protein ACFFED_04725 [Candidatus Thorarchaeota archaeon]